MYSPIINIIIPKMYFKTTLSFPYLGFCVIFFIVPTDVPAITNNMLFPIQYSSNKNIPYRIFSLFDANASNATSTGVEHGDAKTPPSIPAMIAPI